MIYFIISSSYLLLTPSILLTDNNKMANFIRNLIQSLSQMILTYGFDMTCYMAKTDQKILNDNNINKLDILIANHISTIDSFVIMALLEKYNIKSFYYIYKNEIKYFPGFGLFAYANKDIKINRNWEKDKDNITKQLDNIPITSEKQILIIFPEGTRQTPTKIKEGQLFSEKNNIQSYNNLLVPRIKGLHHIVKHLVKTNKMGKIWDLTLIIPKYMKEQAYITDIVGCKLGPVCTIIREVPLKEYEDMDKFKTYFLDYWKTKDNIIENYNSLIYEKINFENNSINIINILIISLFSLYCYTNKYGRYYMLVSFIISYIKILSK